jgi:hypothetical protein
MTDRTYYKIMNWLGWSLIALGLIEVVLYLTGLYPEFTWQGLDLPMLAVNLLVMVRLLRDKDETIETQERIIDTLRK